MAGCDHSLRGICFDLFGTLVFFDPKAFGPSIEGATRFDQAAASLAPVLEREFPGLSQEDFAQGLATASAELKEARGQELYEYSSQERFERALLRAGVDTALINTVAIDRLVAAHMGKLVRASFLPSSHAEVLRKLSCRYRLGLVSNFDHSRTARTILAKTGIATLFDAIVISVEVRRRKPHRLPFVRALAGMGVEPHLAMHVGDTLAEDIAGAQQLGMTTAWVSREVREQTAPRADYVISQLPALLEVLA